MTACRAEIEMNILSGDSTGILFACLSYTHVMVLTKTNMHHLLSFNDCLRYPFGLFQALNTTVLLYCESLPKHQIQFSLGLQKFL